MNLPKILPVVLLLAVPQLSLAQLTDIEPVTTTVDTAEITSDARWYEVDRIFGDIEVGDFVVGPGRTELSLVAGQTEIRYLTVTNRISDGRSFKFQIEDISGSADGSSALQIIEGERGPYSIRDYISFQEDTITLGLGERARIPVTISVPPDAEPGGFYGSVLVSTVQVGDSEAAIPQNPIIARVGSHFFLTVEGEKEVGGRVLDVSIVPDNFWYESGPLLFGIAYENTGSIHVNPYGELSISNMFGDEVGYVQLDPWFVLPKSIRTREVEWDKEFLFGRYTARATINRGYDDVLDEFEVSFWVLPWKLLLVIFGSIFTVVWVIRFFFRTFEFKRRS